MSTGSRGAGFVDVAVVGAGLMGSAAAWAASRRGLSVQLVDQFEIGHVNGSSHGSARIVRRAYDDALYTALTGRAFELWDELEQESGETMLRLLGGLDHGPAATVRSIAEHLTKAGVDHELLSAGQAERRWPGMRFDDTVLFHKQAGTVDADATVRAFLALAVRNGATINAQTTVERIVPSGDHALLVLTDGRRLRADRVIVAAGSWIPTLLGQFVPLPMLTVQQQHVFHFRRLEPNQPPSPSVIHHGDHAVYHLAGGRDGGPDDARKLGMEGSGVPVEPGAINHAALQAAQSTAREYVSRWLPGLDPSPLNQAACRYTNTTNRDFLIDTVGPLVLCSPCSGHGAKFAPLVGELCADLATGDRAAPDRFRLSAHRARPAQR